MSNSTLQAVTQPDTGATDPLHELLRKGARDLIAKAVEAELSTFLEQYADKTLEDGRRVVVRNGYLPERTVQTGIGDVEIKVPRVRDRSGDGVTFSSALLPPYLKRARSIEELIPWLYLKGVSTGNYDAERAEARIKENTADAVAFGRPYIANPDLPERFRVNAPLTEPNHETFYGGDEKGYTDYPFLNNGYDRIG